MLTVEALHDGVQLLAAAAGWVLPNMTAARRGSQSGSAARLAALDATTRAALEAKVAHDAELYRYAQELGAQRASRKGARTPVRPRVADCAQLRGGDAEPTGGAPLRLSPPAGGGPYGNWSHGCRHDGAHKSLCASVLICFPPLWLTCSATQMPRRLWPPAPWRAMRAASCAAGWRRCERRACAASTSTTTPPRTTRSRREAHTALAALGCRSAHGLSGQVLQPFVDSGLVLPLHTTHPPPRYGVRESASGAPWAGYREAQGRCVTHALLEGACWLLHLSVGQTPLAPLAPPPPPLGEGDSGIRKLSVFSRCAAAACSVVVASSDA